MKYILLFLSSLAIVSCAGKETSNEVTPLLVTISDSDYSMALSGTYELTDSSMTITRIGTLVGESDSILYKRKLTKQEQNTVQDFFRSFPLTSLKDEYSTPYIDDGDQKLFLFQIGKIEKEIQDLNYYQSDLSSLVNLFNELLPDDLQIFYFDDR